jgi:TonB family protein
MSYKALLFCPEDKTARVVTQVLSELEFEVERCNEPFAAVKKLMAEHFDAIVVDNDNEQNATLLFKSARNSGSNQASLSVAVVEGQAGVAKAFRIGANLVLTKPINVEQSKGTLRVARGLLRKTDFTKTAFTPPAVTRPVAASADFKLPPAPEPVAIRPPITSLPVQPPAPVIAVASSSVLEVEQEPEPKPEPAEAALLESMPDPAGTRNHEAPAAASPWQPIPQPVAESVASAIRPTPPTSAKPSADPAGPSAMVASSANVADLGVARSTNRGSAAAAAAPAREAAWPEKQTEPPVEPPLFSSFGGMTEEQGSGSGGAKKVLIAAAILVAVAGAGYVGWTRMHPASISFPQKVAAPVPAAPVQMQAPASTETSTTATSEPNGASAEESQPVEQAPDITLSTAEESSPAANTDTSTPPPVKAAKPNLSAKSKPLTGIIASRTASSKVAPEEVESNPDSSSKQVVVVKNERFKPVPTAPAEEAAPPAPGLIEPAPNPGDQAISGIVAAAPPDVPQPAPHTLKVSQGISQGLLIKKVPPIYPEQARRMRIQGAVELLATIGKNGNITAVKVLSGDRLLAQAAMDAVKQWKYKAYYLDGQAVDFQTQITVNFRLP